MKNQRLLKTAKTFDLCSPCEPHSLRSSFNTCSGNYAHVVDVILLVQSLFKFRIEQDSALTPTQFTCSWTHELYHRNIHKSNIKQEWESQTVYIKLEYMYMMTITSTEFQFLELLRRTAQVEFIHSTIVNREYLSKPKTVRYLRVSQQSDDHRQGRKKEPFYQKIICDR